MCPPLFITVGPGILGGPLPASKTDDLISCLKRSLSQWAAMTVFVDFHDTLSNLTTTVLWISTHSLRHLSLNFSLCSEFTERTLCLESLLQRDPLLKRNMLVRHPLCYNKQQFRFHSASDSSPVYNCSSLPAQYYILHHTNTSFLFHPKIVQMAGTFHLAFSCDIPKNISLSF